MQTLSKSIQEKMGRHAAFFAGEGPSLLLLQAARADLYDLNNYERRFYNSAAMFESERDRALSVIDWPTDGIPAVRPNLGTVFVPETFGQDYQVKPDAMPWPGKPMSRETIRRAAGPLGAGKSLHAVSSGRRQSELLDRAWQFYDLAREDERIYAYHADTQGVFDIAHLLYGEDIFLDLATEQEGPWIKELLDICLDRYIEVSGLLKHAIDEPATTMVHGHGTEQGLFFPSAGVRMSEDTATLLSPQMIESDLMPYMAASAEPFGGAFVHYCGKHDGLFLLLCAARWCRAIDLGNPESYDVGRLFREAARTGTVLYTRLPPQASESPVDYVERLGAAVAETGARVALRSTVVPESKTQAEAMLGRFHELTQPL